MKLDATVATEDQASDYGQGYREVYMKQAYFRDTGGSVPDHHHKESITIKWVMTFLLVEFLVLNNNNRKSNTCEVQKGKAQ